MTINVKWPIFQVPTGHNLVMRNVWSSRSDNQPENDAVEPKGYSVLHEGYVFWLPKIWQTVVGLIDMRPINRDPKGIKVQTIDGQNITINVRITDRVMKGYGKKEYGNESYPASSQPADEDGNPVIIQPNSPNNVLRFAIRVESDGATDRIPLIEQVLTAALNIATADYPSISYSLRDLGIIAATAYKEQQDWEKKTDDEKLQLLPRQLLGWGYWTNKDGSVERVGGSPKTKKGLAEFSGQELKTLAKQILSTANDELVNYGIKLDRVEIQSIQVSGPLQAALERRASSIVEAHSASAERSYLAELLNLLPPGQQNIWATAALIALNQITDKGSDLLGRILGKAKKG